MAVATEKPATSRLEVAGKLTALIGLPLLIIVGLFSAGLYLGATRSYRIQHFEAKWLGFASPDPAADDGDSKLTGETEPEAETEGAETEGAEPESVETGGAEPEPKTPEPKTPDPKTPEPKTPDQPSTTTLPVVEANPVGAELRSLFDEALVVRVKVMVDPALVVAREDWLTHTASLIEATHASFELLFGVDVQLQGIVVWNIAAGAEPEALLADLLAREREGADVILGLVAQAEPANYQPAQWTGDEHGDHALVFADLRQHDRYYRNMLRTLARLLGAQPALDAASKQLGSFMSDAEPVGDVAPVLDPENRGRVIINKHRPFARSGATAGTRPEESSP